MTEGMKPQPKPKPTESLVLLSDVHRFTTPDLLGPKHLQQALRLLMNRLWTLTKARTLRAIMQAVRKRTWPRQHTLQRTTDMAHCCPCPRRHRPPPRTMFRANISKLMCMKTKLSCDTIPLNRMKPRSISTIPAVRRLRAIHLTTATNRQRVESVGTRTKCPRAI